MNRATWILWSKQPSYFEGSTKLNMESILKKYKSKSVFLQHGVFSDISSPIWYFEKVLNKESNYIVTTSNVESDLVKKYSNFNLVPIELGFPRWDFLLEKHILRKREKKDVSHQVLISFHWRAGKVG